MNLFNKEQEDAALSDPVTMAAQNYLLELREQGDEETSLETAIEIIEAVRGCNDDEELETGVRYKAHQFDADYDQVYSMGY